MCVPSNENGDVHSTRVESSVKMERALVIKKDLIVPSRLDYLCTWGGSIAELDGYQKRLREYKKRVVIVGNQGYGSVEVKYEVKSGRLFGDGLCLQSMPKRIRHFIMDNRLVDIDIVNSAPTMIEQVCALHGIETPCLNHFNQNYTRLLSEMNVYNKKKAKACIFFGSTATGIRSVGDGDVIIEYDDDNGGLVNDAPWLAPLKSELDNVVFKGLKALDKYRGFEHMARHRDDVKKAEFDDAKRRRRNVRGDYVSNIRGIFLSLVYFDMETEIVAKIDQVGKRLNIWDNRVSMQFDGLLVYPRVSGISQADLDLISNTVYRDTSFKVRLDFKDTSDKLNVDITRIPEERVVIDMHREAADCVLFLLGQKLYRDGETIFAKRDGVWTSNQKAVTSFVNDQVLHSNILLKVEKNGEHLNTPFSSNGKEATVIAKYVLSGLDNRENFGRDLVLNSAMKLLFRNGYWEFLEEPFLETGIYGRFHHGKSFESGVMIPFDFPMDVDEADIEKVKAKYFDDVFANTEPGLQDNFMLDLARGLAGTPEKITHIVSGPRNCGKSIIFQLMKHCFGGYVTSMNSSTFQVAKGSSDSTRDMSWVIEVEHARLIFMSEAVVSDKSGIAEFCGGKMKIFQSLKEGAVSGRRIYNDPRVIFSNGKGILLCNDVPMFKPHDAYKMVRPYSLPNKFVPQQELDANLHQPTYKLADPEVETMYRQDKYREALTILLLKAFRPWMVTPTEGQTENIDIMEEEVASSVYDDAFFYTGNLNDRVEQPEARALINAHIPAARHDSISREFLKRIRDVNRAFDENKLKQKSNGKKYYRGVKIRTMSDDQNPQQGGGGDGAYAPGFFPGN